MGSVMVSYTKARAEMLDETIDILTLLYQREPFDYDGKHYQLKLTRLDVQHYAPKPVQQPRIPLWTVGVWPRMKSMQRTLKGDGVILEKMSADGKGEPITPADVRDVTAFVEANRTLTTPFDIVVQGKIGELVRSERRDKMAAWQDAGVTWWIEAAYDASAEAVEAILRQGPPKG